MAAIARNCFLAVMLLWPAALPVYGDRRADVKAPLTEIAAALANANAEEALNPFDKALPDYIPLKGYFRALTESFDVVSEIEIADEEDRESESVLKAHWTLELSDRGRKTLSERRDFEVTVRLRQAGSRWKIVSFAPVAMFDPQQPKRGGK